MTPTLDAALATLAPEDQDRIARWLVEEIADEAEWTRQFATSPEALDQLAEEARAEIATARA
jgi:hypothetical protein